MIPQLKKAFVVLALTGLTAAPAFALDGQIQTHDPSTVIICDGKYYVYATGGGISVMTSNDGFTWARGPRIFDRIPDSVLAAVPKNNGNSVWAPDIIKLNNEYYMYYSISSWGEFNSAVGLITSPTLDAKDPKYKWTDKGIIVKSTQDQVPALNAIDPGIFHDPTNGSLWLSYGSYHGNIELVELDPKTGLRIAPDSKVTIIASKSEASDIIFHDGYYYLMVNHGSCCKGADSTYAINMGRSKKVTGPYLDKTGADLASGAGTVFLAKAGTQIGPGHFGMFVDGGLEKFSCHYEADTTLGGRSVLDIRPLLWTADGWPAPGINLTKGDYTLAAHKKTPTDVTTAFGTFLGIEESQWIIAPAGGGFFTITGGTTDKALEALNAKAADKSGTLIIGAATAADNHLWKIEQTSDGSFRIASKVNKLASSAGDKTVTLEPYTGAEAQKWAVAAVPVPAAR